MARPPSKKTSELARATALAGSDLLALAQGGASVSVSLDQIIDFRRISAGLAINDKDFGVVANGSVNDRAGVAAADAAADAAMTAMGLPSGSGSFLMPTGVRLITSDITITSRIMPMDGAMLRPAAGVTIKLAGGYEALSRYQHIFDLSLGGKVIGVRGPSNGRVSVWHFGAKGAGLANDDTAAFNAAINYASVQPIRTMFANSYIVEVPLIPSETELSNDLDAATTTGFYYITDDLVFRRNIVFEGDTDPARSRGGSRIRFSRNCVAGFFMQFPDSTIGSSRGTIPFTAQPGVGSTITLNGIPWTFVASAPSGNQSAIGADLAATLANLSVALNASVVSALSVATYGVSSGTTLTIVYDAPGIGGNSYTMEASAASNAQPSGPTLSAGYEPGPGSSGVTLLKNLYLAPVREGGKEVDTVDVASNVITTKVPHNFQTGDALFETTTGDPISPLIPGNGASMHFYYAIRINATQFKVAATKERALAGTAIDLTSTGSGVRKFILWGQVKFGIVANNPTKYHNITIEGFGEAGLFMHGATSGTSSGVKDYGSPNSDSGTFLGNCILSRVDDVYVTNCVGHGFAVLGANAQVISFHNCTSENNHGSGLKDYGSGGCNVFSWHSQGNTRKVAHFVEPVLTDRTWRDSPELATGLGDQTGLPLVPGELYCVEIDVRGTVSNFRPFMNGVADGTNRVSRGKYNTPGVHRWYIEAGATSNAITLQGTGTVNALSIRRVTTFMPIKDHTAGGDLGTNSRPLNEPGMGEDWRRYWTVIEADTPHYVWETNVFHPCCGAINMRDRSSVAAVVVGAYSEGGIEKGIVPRGSSTIIGGIAANIQRRIVQHPEMGSCQVFGGVEGSQFYEGWRYRGQDESDGLVYGSGLAIDRFTPSFFHMGHSDDDPGAPVVWQWTWSPLRKAYEFARNATTRALSLIGTGWKLGADGPDQRTGPIGTPLFNIGLMIGNGDLPTAAAYVRSVANYSSISGDVKKGDFFLFTGPSTASVAAVALSSGTVSGANRDSILGQLALVRTAPNYLAISGDVAAGQWFRFTAPTADAVAAVVISGGTVTDGNRTTLVKKIAGV